MEENKKRLEEMLAITGYSDLRSATFDKWGCTILAEFTPYMIRLLLTLGCTIRKSSSDTALILDLSAETGKCKVEFFLMYPTK